VPDPGAVGPGAVGAGWVIAAEVASVATPERAALIRPDRPDLAPIILTDSGAAIWERLRRDSPTPSAELVDELGIPADVVESFLAQLADLGFVERI
jgi:hypothetical protein